MATLTLRDLNRATLARQLLLERSVLPVKGAVERLVAMQAQLPQPPYVGLWTRLHAFSRDDLARLIEERAIVKATFLRGTLHLLTAEDYVRFRATLQPALQRGSESIVKQRGTQLDVESVLAMGKQFLAEQPRTFAEITAMFSEQMPDTDVGALRYTVRMNVPLIQVPVSTGWGYPATPQFTLAEAWLGKPIPTETDLRALAFRYLAAFGPATLTDIQTWSGLGKLKEAVEKLKPELSIHQDERKRELLDVPDGLLPPADTPVPERFLPEFDNLLLSHTNRTRVVADAHRSKVYLPGLRVAATFLVDGFVAGTWKVEKSKKSAALILEPFEPLSKQNRRGLSEEAENLVRFIEPAAKSFEVRFAD